MKIAKWMLLILAVMLGGGFLLGAIVPEHALQTAMACSCDDVNGERPCNDVSMKDPLLLTGIFNVWQVRSGREIIVCENGQQTGRRIMDAPGKDKYEITGVLSFIRGL